MQIHFERKNACRLYTALGQLLWLHSSIQAAANEEQKLEALDVLISNLETEIGVRRLTLLQDEVYCALTEPHRK